MQHLTKLGKPLIYTEWTGLLDDEIHNDRILDMASDIYCMSYKAHMSLKVYRLQHMQRIHD